jgi:2,4-diaminopentanoate dehydrogenase
MPRIFRIVHWGTGAVGGSALRAMLERRDYHIVGHGVHNPAKEGRDSGELVGVGATGITTTRNIAALIALKPDAFAYFGNAMADPMASVHLVARFLEAGINVVTTGLYELMARETAPKEMLSIIERACEAGRSSFYSTGCDPGICTSQLPVTCLSAAHRVEQLRLQEFADYGVYPDEPTVRGYMGFGLPLDAKTALTSGEMQRRVWRSTVAESARALGLEVEEYHTTQRTAPAASDRPTAAVGTIEKGTTSAMWFQLIGKVAGVNRVIVEHVNWVHIDDVPSAWPTPVRYQGQYSGVGYRIVVKGEPSFDVEFQMHSGREGLLITALHATNAIPMVASAPPGLVNQAHVAPYGVGPLRSASSVT